MVGLRRKFIGLLNNRNDSLKTSRVFETQHPASNAAHCAARNGQHTPTESESVSSGTDSNAANRQQRRTNTTSSARRRRHARAEQAFKDTPETLLLLIMASLQELWTRTKVVSTYIMVDLGGYRFIDAAAQWIVQNPQTSIVLLVGAFILFFPFLILIGFGLATVLMTFMGFLFVGGSFLSILSALLFGCLFALALLLMILAIVAVTMNLGFTHICDSYGGELSKLKLSFYNFLHNVRTNAQESAQNARNFNYQSQSAQDARG